MKLLEAEKLDIVFYSERTNRALHAVDSVSFTLDQGEFLGLVGESGCGKSTIAKLLTGLIKPDSGAVFLGGKELHYPFSRKEYKRIQMVFQMPQESFDPRRTLGQSVVDIQLNFGVSRTAAKENARRLLDRVGLNNDCFYKYPHEVSGGECQRAAIARALTVRPEILICDETTSALDVSVQAQVVELLEDLKREYELSVLFISHDIALVQGLCDRMLVMHGGEIVESGAAHELVTAPQNDYTKQLIGSVLCVDDLSRCQL